MSKTKTKEPELTERQKWAASIPEDVWNRKTKAIGAVVGAAMACILLFMTGILAGFIAFVVIYVVGIGIPNWCEATFRRSVLPARIVSLVVTGVVGVSIIILRYAGVLPAVG